MSHSTPHAAIDSISISEGSSDLPNGRAGLFAPHRAHVPDTREVGPGKAAQESVTFRSRPVLATPKEYS